MYMCYLTTICCCRGNALLVGEFSLGLLSVLLSVLREEDPGVFAQLWNTGPGRIMLYMSGDSTVGARVGKWRSCLSLMSTRHPLCQVLWASQLIFCAFAGLRNACVLTLFLRGLCSSTVQSALETSDGRWLSWYTGGCECKWGPDLRSSLAVAAAARAAFFLATSLATLLFASTIRWLAA